MISRGTVLTAGKNTLSAMLPAASLGKTVRVGGHLPCEVVRVEGERATLAPLGDASGVRYGEAACTQLWQETLPLGGALLGSAIDAFGNVLAGRRQFDAARRPIEIPPIDPRERRPIAEPLWTGIPALDGFATLGRGSRIGLFGPPGSGKSQLLQRIVRQARADACVVALVGERGREAAELLEHVNRRTTVVCATSDRPAFERTRAARVAVAQADALRRRGLDVVLVIDSLARFVSALRELALGRGELPGRGGYPPSVFGDLARLLECAGMFRRGSITVVASVLPDGGDENEPLSEAARALLDGHVVLSAALAQRGKYPAIDVLASMSRAMATVTTNDHRAASHAIRTALGLLDETRELRTLGLANSPDPALAQAIAAESDLDAFFRGANGYGDIARAMSALAGRFRVPAA